MPSGGTWVKMLAAGAVLCIGGPALVAYVSPTEEELFKRYNPDLQRRSLQNRTERQQEFDDFVNRLKEASKSDKPIWEAVAEIETKRTQAMKEAAAQERASAAEELERRRREMRSSTGS